MPSALTVKFGLVRPSAVSVADNVPVLASSSSSAPVVSPPNVAASFTAVTDVESKILAYDIALSPPFVEASIIDPLAN